MRYCKKCLNVDTRPNIKFSEDGICPPCQAKDIYIEYDWEDRKSTLENIKNFAFENTSNGFNCIVGVSGGKDSTRQAFHIRDKFKLKPLLVSMNYPPEQISMAGVDNLSNLISNGFDCVNISCGPKTWKKAMKYAFIEYGNWAKATEHALAASVARMAIAYKIPLIWWGESPALSLGELGVSSNTPYDGSKLKYCNTLSGGDANWLLDAGIKANQLLQYKYPTDQEMKMAKLRIIYMDYFMKDFSHFINGNFAALRGLSLRKPNPNLDPDYYGISMLDEDFINTNMYMRYLKFGFGRATDIVNIEIRAGRMTRDQGIRIVNRFDGSYDPKLVESFCNYIEISLNEFWSIADKFVNKKLFRKITNGKYERIFEVGKGI
ncbi:LPS biosynthesis protein [bacterium]|nr:LPS biosynthesis protein [bacterium]